MASKWRTPNTRADAKAFELDTFGGRPVRVEMPKDEANSFLAYSRRYERPLSILNLRVSFQDPAKWSEAPSHVSGIDAQTIIGGRIRETDLVVPSKFIGQCVIFCPETNVSEIKFLVRRIKTLTASIGIALQFGIASYPDDGYTIENLISASERRLDANDSASANLGEQNTKI